MLCSMINNEQSSCKVFVLSGHKSQQDQGYLQSQILQCIMKYILSLGLRTVKISMRTANLFFGPIT